LLAIRQAPGWRDTPYRLSATAHSVYSQPPYMYGGCPFHVSRKGEMRHAHKIFVGKPEGKRPLGKRRRRRKDNNKMNLRETRWEVVYWIHMAQDTDQ